MEGGDIPMSAQALLEGPGRRPGRRSAARRGRPEAPIAITRNALVADFLAICELDPQVEALRAPAPPASFTLGQETIEHVADFEIVRAGSVALVAVVAESDLPIHPLRAAAVRV